MALFTNTDNFQQGANSAQGNEALLATLFSELPTSAFAGATQNTSQILASLPRLVERRTGQVDAATGSIDVRFNFFNVNFSQVSTFLDMRSVAIIVSLGSPTFDQNGVLVDGHVSNVEMDVDGVASINISYSASDTTTWLGLRAAPSQDYLAYLLRGDDVFNVLAGQNFDGYAGTNTFQPSGGSIVYFIDSTSANYAIINNQNTPFSLSNFQNYDGGTFSDRFSVHVLGGHKLDGGDVAGQILFDAASYTTSGALTVGFNDMGGIANATISGFDNGSPVSDSLTGIEGITTGNGDDRFVIANLSAAHPFIQFDAGDGTDLADFRTSTAAVTVYADGAAPNNPTPIPEYDLRNFEKIYLTSRNDTATNGKISYEYSASGIQALVTASVTVVTGGADVGTDQLYNSKSISGSSHDDTFTIATKFFDLDGGAGIDTADFRGQSAGLVVDLSAINPSSFDTLNVTRVDGTAFAGILVDFEHIIGTRFDDQITGDVNNPNPQTFEGAGGADTIIGLGTSDTASYEHSSSGVNVDLGAGTASGGDAQGDTLIGIENLTGSRFNDTLGGDSGDNFIEGGGGIDTVTLAGDLTLQGPLMALAPLASAGALTYDGMTNSWIVDTAADGHDTLHDVEIIDTPTGRILLIGPGSFRSLAAAAAYAAANPPAPGTADRFVSTLPPAVPSITGIAPDTGISASDNLTRSPIVTVNGTGEPGSVISLYVTVGSTQTFVGETSVDAMGHWSIGSVSLVEGANELDAFASSILGIDNNTPGTLFATLDSFGPSRPTASLLFDSNIGGDYITNYGDIAVTQSEAGGSLEYSTDFGMSWSNTFTAQEGANNVEVRQVDDAGNPGAPSLLLDFDLDTTPPVLAFDPALKGGLTKTATQTISGTSDQPAGSNVFIAEGMVVIGSATVGNNGRWSTSVTLLGLGDHTLYAVSEDVAGNQGQTTATVTFTLDSAGPAAPVVTLVNDIGTPGHPISTNGLLHVDRAEPGGFLQYSVNGGTFGSTYLSALALGADTVAVRQVDAAGNAGTAATLNFDLQFDAFQYLATFDDLIRFVRHTQEDATHHYTTYGRNEGRTADGFDGWQYEATYDDLIRGLAHNETAAAQHFVDFGFTEGRTRDGFDGYQYLASYDDLIETVPHTETTAAQHFVNTGFAQGRARDAFDGLRYVASYGDLIGAFGGHNVAAASIDSAAARHFVDFGFSEHRSRGSFDASQYLANYADLRAAFGTNQAAAELHFIQFGYFEGRTDHV